MDRLIFVDEITCKDRLMVCDSVAQMTNALQVGIGLGAARGNRQSGRRTRKDRSEMRVPKTAILSGGEDVFLKGKFEFSNDLAGRRQFARAGLKIVGGVVADSACRARQASNETIVPGPARRGRP